MGWWVFLLRNLNGGVKFLESNCYGREQSYFKLCMSELVVIRPASNNKMECPRICLSDKNMHSKFQTQGRGSRCIVSGIEWVDIPQTEDAISMSYLVETSLSHR